MLACESDNGGLFAMTAGKGVVIFDPQQCCGLTDKEATRGVAVFLIDSSAVLGMTGGHGRQTKGK